MSFDNVVTINGIYEAFENRDIATFFNFLSPDIHITQCLEVPWGGVFQGIGEAKVFFGKIDTYLDNHVAIELIVDGGDRIAVVGRAHGTIRGTGTPFNAAIMHLWALKDGLAVRLEVVVDVPTILAALQAQTQSVE